MAGNGGHSGLSLRCFDDKSWIRRMYQNKFIIGLTVLSTSFFVKCQQGSGNTASGNAMDLAFMNMNMMGHNSNCDIQPCQTVCQVLNTTSGCYVCSTSCTAGTGTGLNAPLNPPGQIPIGGVTGCEPNWMQCPISCVRKYNLGCVTCDCGADTQKIPTTSVLLSTPQSKTDTKSRLQSSQFTKDLSTGTETIAPTTSAISSTVLASVTSRMPDTNYTQQQIQQILSLTTQPSGTKTSTVRKLPSTTDIRFSRNSTTRTEAFSYANLEDLRKESSINSESDSNDGRIVVIVLVFLLSTFFVISVTLLVVLLIVWRRSSRELKRNKNELYFIHKAYRQDSKAQLQNNEFDMDEPVYAQADKPEVPPRSPSLPSLFPTVISTELKASASSQTNEKSVYQSHDYLELI